MKVIKAFIVIAISFVVIGAMAEGILKSWDSSQVSHCKALNTQMADMPRYDRKTDTGYYVTQDEYNDCQAVGITLLAHVK